MGDGERKERKLKKKKKSVSDMSKVTKFWARKSGERVRDTARQERVREGNPATSAASSFMPTQ